MRSVIAAIVLAGCASLNPFAGSEPNLTDPYPCGYGFWMSDADQTSGLFVEYTDFEGASAGEVMSGEIGQAPWSAELRFGTDLFANWCDDVFETGEPEAIVEQVWTVEGQVVVDLMPAAGECGPARATLTDLVATNDSGRTVDMDDMTVTNDAWGCFAG